MPRGRVLSLLGAAGSYQADWSYADGGEAAPSSDVVGLVTVDQPVGAELLERFSGVRVVSVSFTGYDHVDSEYCRGRGIAVYAVPGYSTDSVVELAVGLALSLLRNIPAEDRALRRGEWHGNRVGLELAGRTCGIIGTGTVGVRLAGVLRALRCTIVGWSRRERPEFKELGGRYVGWPDIFSISHIVFVTIALTGETRGLIGPDELGRMGGHAYLVNVARGPVVDRDALVHAVTSGQIGGAGLDVYDVEPLPADDPIRRLPRSVLTPHIAYRTEEALDRKANVTVANLHRGLTGEPTNRVV